MNILSTSTKGQNIRKYQTEIREPKNTVTKLKNTLKRFDSRLDGVEEWVSELEDKVTELTQSRKKNFKKVKKWRQPKRSIEHHME